mmetsp:Transcript_63082/g.195296  ORF Transcript_63082/g.195296 Transcript_63082/m.195296 type:complete len:97 (+) Transcript_63082:2-292(+)
MAVTGALGAVADPEVFERLHVQDWRLLVETLAIQICMEVFADLLSLIVAFTILPISLEGIFKAHGRWSMEASCIVVSLIFVFSTLNMRIRIQCFSL